MSLLVVFRYLKIGAVVVAAIALTLFYKDYTKTKAENKILNANFESVVKKDSIRFSEQTLTPQQTEQKIYYQDPELLKKLDGLNIKIKNLQKVTTTKTDYSFQDTVKHSLHKIYEGVKQNRPVKQKVESKTDCHLMSAIITYDGGKKLTLDSLELKTLNRLDIIASIETWRIKHLIKRRKVIVTVIDKCGNSTTEIIHVQKRRKK